MIGSEKDEILREALESILEEFIEISLVNKDHLGYYQLLQTNICNIPIGTFVNGTRSLQENISVSENVSDLSSLHTRFIIRCINSEIIMTAANNVYDTLSQNLLEMGFDINYDLIVSQLMINLNSYKKILLLIHIYNDRLTVGLTAAYQAAKVKKV